MLPTHATTFRACLNTQLPKEEGGAEVETHQPRHLTSSGDLEACVTMNHVFLVITDRIRRDYLIKGGSFRTVLHMFV